MKSYASFYVEYIHIIGESLGAIEIKLERFGVICQSVLKIKRKIYVFIIHSSNLAQKHPKLLLLKSDCKEFR